MQTATLTLVKFESIPSPWKDLWVLGVVVLLVSFTRAQSTTAGEYQIKAAFLYNFAKFVEWPPGSFPDADAPFRICVFGRDPFGESLRNITREKTMNGHRLEVHQIVDLQTARSCQILFIAASEQVQLKRILENMGGSNALTVGDTTNFVEQGGMINFVLENDRVRFEVSRRAADQAGLKISSKLLAVAKVVIG
jgi:hypothetical protein